MFEKLPPELLQSIYSAIWTFLMAWIGRLTWHVYQVQKGTRRFWSLHLVWELITALAIGFVADGLVHYYGLGGKIGTGLTVAVAYLGPRGLEVLMLRALKRYQDTNSKG